MVQCLEFEAAQANSSPSRADVEESMTQQVHALTLTKPGMPNFALCISKLSRVVYPVQLFSSDMLLLCSTPVANLDALCLFTWQTFINC